MKRRLYEITSYVQLKIKIIETIIKLIININALFKESNILKLNNLGTTIVVVMKTFMQTLVHDAPYRYQYRVEYIYENYTMVILFMNVINIGKNSEGNSHDNKLLDAS